MGYVDLEQKLEQGDVVILDGGTGTELERRGVPMNQNAWCGPATLDHLNTLEAVHLDYINAGADVITANTYASSRLMLTGAGLGDQVKTINRAAIETAHRARGASGRSDILVAGSLSHMIPVVDGTAKPDLSQMPDPAEMARAFREISALHVEGRCDLILLEMMYDPIRMPLAFEAATQTGLPVWAGFSVRRGEDGRILAFSPERDIPFEKTVQVLADFDVAAAGIMHSPSNVVGDALAILRDAFGGPLIAYPDSGYFKMPSWQFDDIIPPATFRRFADDWVEAGVQVLGGCCGLSPEHIGAVASLKQKGHQAYRLKDYGKTSLLRC